MSPAARPAGRNPAPVSGVPTAPQLFRLLEAPRFRMGYDFLALRAASGEVSEEIEAWWRSFQSADPDSRA